MSGHTPGPWVMDDPNTTFVAKDIDGVYHYICAVEPNVFSTDDPSREEKEANARLIAAAPELLEAVTLLMDCKTANPISMSPPERQMLWEAHAKARAAIAKATGAV